MTLTVTKDRVSEILKLVQDMTKKQVLIGVPAEGSDRTPEPGEKTTPNNAVIGYINEFGDPEMNIPARPHLIPGVESILPRAVPILRQGGVAALEGKRDAVDASFEKVGLLGEAAVRNRITSGPFVKLAPRTLARRKSKGRTGEKPLIDSAQYRRSITYVVRKRGS